MPGETGEGGSFQRLEPCDSADWAARGPGGPCHLLALPVRGGVLARLARVVHGDRPVRTVLAGGRGQECSEEKIGSTVSFRGAAAVRLALPVGRSSYVRRHWRDSRLARSVREGTMGFLISM